MSDTEWPAIRALTPEDAKKALDAKVTEAVKAEREGAWIRAREVICSKDWTDCDGDVFCDAIAAAIREGDSHD